MINLNFVIATLGVALLPIAPLYGQGGTLRQSATAGVETAIKYQSQEMKTATLYGEALHSIAGGMGDMQNFKMTLMRDYWTKKDKYFEELLKSVDRKGITNRISMFEQRRRTLSVWERTFNDPVSTRFAAHSGRSLNMILDQFNIATTLPYSPSPPSGVGLQAGDEFKLNETILRAIRLEVKLAGGPTVISLYDTLPARFDWWPYSLREPEFDRLRLSLSSLREQVASQLSTEGKVEFDLLKRLESEMEKLVAAFYTKYPTEKWKQQDTKNLKRLYAAEAFLKQSDREVSRLADIGDRPKSQLPNYIDTATDKNVTTLCHWMLSHGLRFAPAAVGDEPTYTQLFEMLKQYCAAADLEPDKDWVEAVNKSSTPLFNKESNESDKK